MKTILLPVHDDEGQEARLEAYLGHDGIVSLVLPKHALIETAGATILARA